MQRLHVIPGGQGRPVIHAAAGVPLLDLETERGKNWTIQFGRPNRTRLMFPTELELYRILFLSFFALLPGIPFFPPPPRATWFKDAAQPR